MDEFEQLADASRDLVLGPLADLEAEGHVAVHAHVLERGVVLEHETHVAALRREPGGIGAGDLDHPRVGLLEPGDDAQQGRLAAAARAEQSGQRPRRNIDGHVLERDEVAETLRHVARGDGHQASSSLGRSTFITTRITTAMNARTNEAAYAPATLKFWNCCST